MPGGSCGAISELPEGVRALVGESRRAVLSTLGAGGRPHAVPVCYALRGEEIVSPLDDKPKGDKELARVRNLARNPQASLLVDRWDEDWDRLAWVMLRGPARVEQPGDAWRRLLARYPQYEEMEPATRVIVLRPERITWWTWGA